MLSESKLIEKKRLNALPRFERPITVRLKFKKVGSLQYISHLDLQRTFYRIIERACLPVWYTKGFNPHAKLVFSTLAQKQLDSISGTLEETTPEKLEVTEIERVKSRRKATIILIVVLCIGFLLIIVGTILGQLTALIKK